MKKYKICCALLLALGSVTFSACDNGYVSPTAAEEAKLYVGQKLWSSGYFGRIMEISPEHTFENGAVEAGVRIDVSEREGMEHVKPFWLPSRSAVMMVHPN